MLVLVAKEVGWKKSWRSLRWARVNVDGEDEAEAMLQPWLNSSVVTLAAGV